jgi:Holliday junction resolvasome RuvABC endonuclease subunit
MKFSDESFIYRIMGIDNGTSLLGMVIMDLDLRTGRYKYIDRDTLVAEKILGVHLGTSASHGVRWAKCNALYDSISASLRFYNPHSVAVETPFFMPGRVQSFEALTEMMIFIRRAVAEYNPMSDIYRVSPGEAKRAVQRKNFTMKKVVMKDCILALEQVDYPSDIDTTKFTEHEYDAIAVIIAHGEQTRKRLGFVKAV